MTNTNLSQPKTLYIPNFAYPWFVSEKQGLCKAVPFKLKFVSSSKKRIDLVLAAAKLAGFDKFESSCTRDTLWLNYLNSTDEIVIVKNRSPNLEIVTPDRKALYKTDWVGVYRIVGRSARNTQREAFEKKKKRTEQVRKNAIKRVKLLSSFSNKLIGIDSRVLRDLINDQLKKKGFAEIPKTAHLYLE